MPPRTQAHHLEHFNTYSSPDALPVPSLDRLDETGLPGARRDSRELLLDLLYEPARANDDEIFPREAELPDGARFPRFMLLAFTKP